MAKQEIVSVWILGDQLLKVHPALDGVDVAKKNTRVVMIESSQRTARLPYQRKKLVLLFSAMRHYAERLRADGYQVDYLSADHFLDGLQQHISEHHPARLVTMAASEYGMRSFQQNELPDHLDCDIEVLPNTQFLISQYNPYPDPDPNKHYVMENFYRDMRRHFDILMEPNGKPVGDRWNFDEENRKKLPKKEAPPDVIGFEPDGITHEVMKMVEKHEHGVGIVTGFDLAVTHEQAEQALQDFVQHRLVKFGTYEDAMTSRHRTIYHSVLSPYVNIGLLEPMQMIKAVERAYHEDDAPINSVEGFIRQIIGWREFIYWRYWQQMPDLADANHWRGDLGMPQIFWDARTDMNCIQHVVQGLLDDGYSHHIERLMVICNFCLLIGVRPRDVADWFLAFYIDAYEWVVYPNVIGMGLNADGGQIATKPYIASANYINKMSDYCKGCQFHHTKRSGENACPFNYLYWNFIIENEEALRANPRSGRNVLALRHIDDDERAAIRAQARAFIDGLRIYES